MLSPLVHALAQHGGGWGAGVERSSPWVTHGAPVHAAHDESQPHSHDPRHAPDEDAPAHSHGDFSVEHLQALLVAACVLFVARGLLLALGRVLHGEERPGSHARWALSPAMPQGP